MSWFEAIPAMLVAATLVVVIGAPIAFSIGARGVSWLGYSVGASIASIAGSSILTYVFPVSWSVILPLAISIVIASIVLILRRLLPVLTVPEKLRPAEWGRTFVIGALSVLAGGTIIGLVLKNGIGMPDWPSQSYDAIFHLNAVQHILQTGDASPFGMTLATPDQASGFYPTAWHAFVALIVQLTGASIPLATIAGSFAAACVVWPVACVFLVRQLLGSSPLAFAAAGVLSAAFAAFPYLLVHFGVLYPNLLAVALLPISIGALVSALGLGKSRDIHPLFGWLALAWVTAGMAVAHPNAIFTLFVVAVPLVVAGSWRYVTGSPPEKRRARAWIAYGIGGLALIAAVTLWVQSKTSDNSWQPYQSVGQAVGEVLLSSPLHWGPAYAAAALTAGGAIMLLLKRRMLWLVVAQALTMFLFIVVTSWPAEEARTMLTGLWYNDSKRLAAILPVLSVPLATVAAVALIRVLQRWVGARNWAGLRKVSRPARNTATAIVGVILVAVLTHDGSIAAIQPRLAAAYQLSENSAVLSPDELAIFDDIRGLVDSEAVIAGNPWNGSALAYAYTGRKVLFPHVGGAYSGDRWLIAKELSTSSESLCGLLAEFNVQYVLDFQGRILFGDDPRSAEFPGFDNLATSDSVELVAQHGLARLYRITLCDPA